MSWSDLSSEDTQALSDSSNPHAVKRSKLLTQTKEEAAFDILIVGGGIQGATFAHLAAFNGFRTLLLERDDFSSGTSSRTSNLAHGGFRYLQNLDFRQVRDGVQAREELLRIAPHLVTRQEFAFPIESGNFLGKATIGMGLLLYNLFANWTFKLPSWRPLTNESALPLCRDFGGYYSYCDASMSDSRIVLERILAARQEGALTLNYAEVESVRSQKEGGYLVQWKDTASLDLKNQPPGNSRYLTEAGIVINCAGAWAPFLTSGTKRNIAPKVVFSRGTHLVFSTPWHHPALILPIRVKGKAIKGRYYFILPHPAGTLVGTSEQIVSAPQIDPKPSEAEIEEILVRIKQDLREKTLIKENLIYAYCGIRTLVDYDSKKKSNSHENSDSSKLSRRPLWHYDGAGVLTLVGGKYTTAAISAKQGLKKVFELTGITRKLVDVSTRSLPGAHGYLEESLKFREFAERHGIPGHLVDRAIRRWGGRVRYLCNSSENIQPLANLCLKGECQLAVEVEQAHSIEDIFRRRLLLDHEYKALLEAMPELVTYLQSKFPEIDWITSTEKYRQHLELIQKLVHA